jgi:hypothetical protein
LAVDEKVRRPWRRIAVPGKGPANTEVKHAHEHGESICIPEWAGDPVEGAIDDGVELGRLR